MKKLLLFLLLSISFTSFSTGLEFRANLDLSGDYVVGEEGDSQNLKSGYAVKSEFLYGETFEYGAGVSIKSYGMIDDESISIEHDSIMSSSIFYGSFKTNLGTAELNPYIRLSAGLSFNESEYFDKLAEDISITRAEVLEDKGWTEETISSANAEQQEIYESLISKQIETYEAEEKMGLYFGAAFGVERDNILAELSYEIQTIGVEVKSDSNTNYDNTLTFSTISIEVGYRLGIGN